MHFCVALILNQSIKNNAHFKASALTGTAMKQCIVACAKNKKSLNFASSDSWHLKVGMETPENDFQIHRPINDPWQAVCSLERGYRWGNIQKSFSDDNF